jgi:uncharacterized protein with HEPN domain
VSRSDEQRVQDILDASGQILEVVREGRAAWDKDRLKQLAVERLLEIIGESANSLSDDFRARYPGIAWRDSSVCVLYSHTTTTASTPTRYGSLPKLRWNG